jgi:hypothetical protein
LIFFVTLALPEPLQSLHGWVLTRGGHMDKSLGSHDLPFASASLADFILKTGLHTQAVTALTGLDPWNFDFFFDSKDRLKKADGSH